MVLHDLLETIHRGTYGRVPPAVSRPIARIAREHGVLAAEALQLRRQPAAVMLRLHNSIDTIDDPIRPAVFPERARIGRVGALDVRLLELAHVAEDPVARELGHGLLLDVVLAEDPVGPLPDALKPGHVARIPLLERHPLRVDDDGARPGDDAVLAVELGVFARHHLV